MDPVKPATPAVFEPCAKCKANGEASRAKGFVGYVLCGECAARREIEEAAAAKSVAHPPPWRWGDSKMGSKHRLLDANGDAITLAWADDTSRGYRDVAVRVANKRIESIIAAAPETADLLRRAAELVNWLSPFAYAYAAEHPESNMPTKVDVDDVCRGAADLLARLDAARGA